MSDPEPGRLAAVRDELCELAAHDARVRTELAADGSLFGGYHPRMEAVHRQNSARLAAIIDDLGWPSESFLGPEAAQAAWLIAQHAIGEPELQRRCLGLLLAAERGEVPAWQPAMLEDRVRVFEGRLQRYGTQQAPDDEGWLRPCAIRIPRASTLVDVRSGWSPFRRSQSELSGQYLPQSAKGIGANARHGFVESAGGHEGRARGEDA